MEEFTDLVDRSLSDETLDEFDQRVEEQADRLADALRNGRLDNPCFGLGIELEAYAVDEAGQLCDVPKSALEGPCEKELGLHNVEFNTNASRFDEAGVDDQAAQLRRNYQQVQAAALESDREIVLDAMWTIPPAEGTDAYFGAVREENGVTIAENMTPSPRYYAIDNAILEATGGEISFSVPGVEAAFPSILFESLTSSIQPHVQVPDGGAFPQYYNTAIGTLGPVLALATNAPLAPADLYEIDDPYELLETTHHELRIPAFEQAINQAWHKVRFPEMIEDATDTVDLLCADQTCAPFLREWLEDGERETIDEQFWELNHKRGTYWRWLRSVIGGQPVGEGDQWSIRIEYRPVPAQPTVGENIGLQCLVAGLVHGLCLADHPLAAIDQERAAQGFYNAVEDGIDADLEWITADGDRTTDSATIYDEVFRFARQGLRDQGVSLATIETYLDPIERRWDERTTPSRWKLDRVREELDAGRPFDEAVTAMQTEYIERSGVGEPVVEWS